MTANLLGIDSKEPIQAAVKTAPMKLGMTSTSSLSFAQNWKTILLTSQVEASSANFDFGCRANRWVYIYAITFGRNFSGIIGTKLNASSLPGSLHYRKSYTCLVEPQKGFTLMIILHNIPFLGAKNPSVGANC